MRVEDCPSYEVVEKREIKELDSFSYILRHKKTGARVALLSNDDENKVFYIGFRTPPVDSTGAAHIVEHTVLCGSEKFPVKDPFIELAKGSLNTFLNAMTFPDKTIYPISSCNDKDFQNLMHVYLDAVFYPNIYKEDKIFKQEGWHYELESPEDDLKINGVVYNEMKGAFSSADSILERELMNSLYPDTSYSYESGGDPDVIPELTYEEFLNFHRRYYHPSNSYIYLYGNMDMAEKLEFIDREYLSAFDEQPVDSVIAIQTPFEEMKELQKVYSISEGESLENNTYLSISKVVADCLDRELYVAFKVLDAVLCSSPGAPLKKAMIEKGIGTEVYSIFEEGVRQPYFSVVAKNAELSQKQLFLDTYDETLQKLVKEGINKKSLYAALNAFEFKHREADFGSYQKGLMYGIQILDSWLHDDRKPFIHLEANETFAALKEKVESHYFEDLIDRYLLHNPHGTVLVMTPEKGLTAKREKELADRLSAYKATLSQEEVEDIVAETKALKEYQEEPDTPEALATIPHLTREDMKKEADHLVNELTYVDGVKVLRHDLFTNEIAYLRMIFQTDHIPEKYFPYLGVLEGVFGLLDTKNYSYQDLFDEINIKTGGIGSGICFYCNDKEKKNMVTYEVRAKALYGDLKHAFELVQEIICHTIWDDEKRIKELLEELKSEMQSDMLAAGHSLASARAMSYFSEMGAVNELLKGISQYRLIEDLIANYDTKKDALMETLQELAQLLFRPENLMMDVTAMYEDLPALPDLITTFRDSLFCEKKEMPDKPYKPVPVKKNEGFLTSSQVQYVCRAGNYKEKGLEYTGALRVLKVMMGYDYLWNNVRVKGGAYGCMCSFPRTGDSYFVSYRDPNLEKTVEVYEKAADYIADYQGSEEEITQYIIGAIGALDTPKTAKTKGLFSLMGYMSGVTDEDLQKERDEVLETDAGVIRSLSSYIRSMMQDECICVVGSEEKVRKADCGLLVKEQLFH